MLVRPLKLYDVEYAHEDLSVIAHRYILAVHEQAAQQLFYSEVPEKGILIRIQEIKCH